MAALRPSLTIVSVLALLVVAAGPAPAVQVVVLDEPVALDGLVSFSPSLATVETGAAPAIFRLANGGPVGIDATVSVVAIAGDAKGEPAAQVHLAAGEAADLGLSAEEVTGGLARVIVTVAGSTDPLVAWVASDPSPVELELDVDGDRVTVSGAEPAVVSVQVRRRSWTGRVSSQVAIGPLLVDPGATVEAGRGPWMPGPAWTDVLVVDQAGGQTRLTVRHVPVSALVGPIVGLLGVLAVLSLLRRRGSGGESATH